MRGAPDTSAIRAFVAIAQAGNILSSARAVGLTRSAAGKALVRLEERLGTRLFHRTTRSIALTAEGRVFFDRCAQMLADLEEAEAVVCRDAAEPAGMLRLTLPETFGRRHVMPILYSVLERWPKLTAKVGFTDRFVDVADEGYDLAVRCCGPLPDTRMVARVVARSGTAICASPGYIATIGEPRTVRDLLKHSRLTLGRSEGVRAWRPTPPGEDAIDISDVGRLHADNALALREASIDGLGVAHLRLFLIGPDIAAGSLSPLLADHGMEELLVCALYWHRHLSAKVKMFVDRLCTDLGNDRWSTPTDHRRRWLG